METRELKKKELKILRNALKFFGTQSFLKTHRFFIVEGEKKNLFMSTHEVFDFVSSNRHKLNFIHAGIKVGEVGSRRVRFTLEGAYYLAGKRKRVFVSERGEMLFLYGRDVFASSVKGWDDGLKEGDAVFISNKDGYILGIGRLVHDLKRIYRSSSDDIVIRNLVDRGEYLRKKKLYDAY